jgi:hypothetical protein
MKFPFEFAKYTPMFGVVTVPNVKLINNWKHLSETFIFLADSEAMYRIQLQISLIKIN